MNILVQHDCGRPEFLALTEQRHRDYCLSVGAGYERPEYRIVSRAKSRLWNRTHAIAAALDEAEDGAVVVWLDPEALILSAEDIFDVLPAAASLAASRIDKNLHLGALWIRASARTRGLFRLAVNIGPRAEREPDLPAFNTAVRRAGVVVYEPPIEWAGYRILYARAPAEPPTPRVIGLRGYGCSPMSADDALGVMALVVGMPPQDAAEAWVRSCRGEAPTPVTEVPLAPTPALGESKPVQAQNLRPAVKVRTYSSGGGR